MITFLRYKKTMTVTFFVEDLNNNEYNTISVPNSIVHTSDTITHMLEYFNTSDVDIKVKQKYLHDLPIYVNFLYGKNHGTITNVDILLNCFDMESYFSDDEFFKYLMKQVYTIWDQFFPVINQVPDERMVYLYTPYEFVPSKYMTNPSFFDEWLKINSNVIIILNMYDEYHTDVHYYDTNKKHIKSCDIYHTYGGTKIGYRHEITWYSSDNNQNNSGKRGSLKSIHNYEDNVKHGIQEAWYANDNNQDSTSGKLKYRYNYKHGESDGVQEMWYPNGQINSIFNYKDGQQDGVQEMWYPNGHIQFILNEKDGRPDGEQRTWGYKNQGDGGTIQLTSHSIYDMGKYIRDVPITDDTDH